MQKIEKQNVIVEDKKLFINETRIFPCLERLGFGAQGDVYKYRIGKTHYALKVFHDFTEADLKKFENMLEINIDSYVSPIKILYVNDKFNGYLMKFCKGKNLEARKLNVPIDEFAVSSTKLFEDTKRLSDLKYSIFDTFISNVMYDEGFRMIDMDSYPYEKDKSIQEIQDLNNRRLNQMLVNIFINSTGLASLFFENVEYTKLIANCNSGKISFEELFNEICMKAYNIADDEIKNLNEIGKVLRKVKKR